MYTIDVRNKEKRGVHQKKIVYIFILMLFLWLVSFTNKTSKPLDNLPKYNSYGNVLEVTNLYDINENLRFHHARFNKFL